ncbi:MAG: hypothetical protein A3G25_10125 [Betaproteobacteria bacterium RIFCSPLOWO2_12_FULL_63_13]|nr:MAG: hypothetical protein A3G25_10125 [Betaproteobacteria bacterium RIFCSPLOWO2_12_FULL_63_13]
MFAVRRLFRPFADDYQRFVARELKFPGSKASICLIAEGGTPAASQNGEMIMNARIETVLFSAIGVLFAFLTIAVPASLAWSDVVGAGTQIEARDGSARTPAAMVSSKIRETRPEG